LDKIALHHLSWYLGLTQHHFCVSMAIVMVPKNWTKNAASLGGYLR
jgi:hypothetical protein